MKADAVNGNAKARKYRHLSDLALLQRVLAGEEHAWNELIARFRGLIYRCITKAVHKYQAVLSNEDTDEIFSEVCLNLLRNDMRKLRAYDPTRGSKLGSWLGLIAINTAYDHLRATARQPMLDRIEGCPERADGRPGPLELLLSAERYRRLNSLAAAFSPRDQRFMELYFGRGMTPMEVARQMNISIKTVYSKKNKIRKRLIDLAQASQPTAMAA
jgi:RNA polymerase sigma-70 factor (ECF subfamily)